MKPLVNQKKNQLNKDKHGYGVEEIWSDGDLITVLDNPKYDNQEYQVFNFKNYAWVVVVERLTGRYITHFPSRKAKKRYGI